MVRRVFGDIEGCSARDIAGSHSTTQLEALTLQHSKPNYFEKLNSISYLLNRLTQRRRDLETTDFCMRTIR